MTKPHKILCHNDLDGGVSAICILNHIFQKYGRETKYSLWFGTYKNVDMYVERLLDCADDYEKIFIADISVHKDLAAEFPDNVVLLDHHDTVVELDGMKGCIVDVSGDHCGASLCYKHLLKDQGFKYKHLKSIVEIAYDYDTWKHILPKKIAKSLNFIYYYYWGDRFVQRFINGFDKFNKEELAHLKIKWDDINKQIANVKLIDMSNDPKYKNKMCSIIIPNKDEVNELCEHALKDKGYEVAIAINARDSKLSARVSKRAAEAGLHAGEFFKTLGVGSGHAQAAGAIYESEKQLELIFEQLMEQIVSLKI